MEYSISSRILESVLEGESDLGFCGDYEVDDAAYADNTAITTVDKFSWYPVAKGTAFCALHHYNIFEVQFHSKFNNKTAKQMNLFRINKLFSCSRAAVSYAVRTKQINSFFRSRARISREFVIKGNDHDEVFCFQKYTLNVSICGIIYLFEKRGRNSVLTEYGKTFLNYVVQASSSIENGLRAVK